MDINVIADEIQSTLEFEQFSLEQGIRGEDVIDLWFREQETGKKYLIKIMNV